MSKKSKSQCGKMNKLREVLEKVYGDGIVKGAKSTAETNYKDVKEAEDEILKYLKKEGYRKVKIVKETGKPNAYDDDGNPVKMGWTS